jgi:putative MATE family efflux protein
VSHPLLTSPIGRSLFRLAGPTTAIMLVQIAVALAETWYIARLGTASLAGAALVVPFVVIMHNMAAGGMGGAVAAAMARALGSGRIEDARALVLHALLLGTAIALCFTLFGWLAAPAIYRQLGGSGPALAEALAFSNVWFGAAIAIWTSFFIGSLMRGGGDAVTPARISVMLSIVYLPLSGILTLGIGDWPGLGIAGIPTAAIVTNCASAALVGRALWRGKLGFTPRGSSFHLQPRLFGEILKVGIAGSVTTVTAALTATLVTGLVGSFGTSALAGYGIGMRLEFMLAPVAFGIGSGMTTLVGIAAGAGDWRRAVKVGWTGGLAAFATIGAAGIAVALLPETWSRLFTSEPDVIAASVACLTRTAPFYCLFGLGLALNFASQGAGRMRAPVAGSFLRLAVAAGGGALLLERWGLAGVFDAIGASLALYGCLIAGSLLIKPWRAR